MRPGGVSTGSRLDRHHHVAGDVKQVAVVLVLLACDRAGLVAIDLRVSSLDGVALFEFFTFECPVLVLVSGGQELGERLDTDSLVDVTSTGPAGHVELAVTSHDGGIADGP